MAVLAAEAETAPELAAIWIWPKGGEPDKGEGQQGPDKGGGRAPQRVPFVDLGVYTRNRCFRLYGCAKVNPAPTSPLAALFLPSSTAAAPPRRCHSTDGPVLADALAALDLAVLQYGNRDPDRTLRDMRPPPEPSSTAPVDDTRWTGSLTDRQVAQAQRLWLSVCPTMRIAPSTLHQILIRCFKPHAAMHSSSLDFLPSHLS